MCTDVCAGGVQLIDKVFTVRSDDSFVIVFLVAREKRRLVVALIGSTPPY